MARNLRGPIHIVDGNIHAEYYTHEMLAEYLPDFWTLVKNTYNSEILIFMQDGASVHSTSHPCVAGRLRVYRDGMASILPRLKSYRPYIEIP